MFKNIRIINGEKYEYLEHSYRIGKKVNKISLYLSKNYSINDFLKLNEKNIEEMTKKKVEFIKKNLKINDFYKYGKQLEYIEKTKFLYQIFFKKLKSKEQKMIIEEFLRNFIINSMQMEGGTISYELAKAIDNNKKMKINFDNVNKDDIPLYKQLKEANLKLKTMRLRNSKQIRDLHKVIYTGTYSFAGKFRREPITFGRSPNLAQTMPQEKLNSGMNKAIEKFTKSKNKIYDFDRIILFHRDYQEVHPFKDGNSRLGRLITNEQFIKLNYPPLIIRGTSSAKYRTTLVKAINENHILPLIKFYYQAYKRTFEKFWKPAIEKAIIENLKQNLN